MEWLVGGDTGRLGVETLDGWWAETQDVWWLGTQAG